MSNPTPTDLASSGDAKEIVLRTYSSVTSSSSLVAEAMYPPEALEGLPRPVKVLALGSVIPWALPI